MNCIIIEDQPPAQRILKKYIKDIDFLSLDAVFSDAIHAMEYLKKHAVDLIFLDIHLPKLSGIDFLKMLPQTPHVILTTAFPDYALESYEFGVIDYLLKPFSFQRFMKAIARIPEKSKQDIKTDNQERKTLSSSEFFIKSGYEYIRINTNDITHIKADIDYVELFEKDKKTLSSDSLKHWQERLKDQKFVRVHKSYLVNLAKIKKVASNQIYINENEIIPIGRAYKDNFFRCLSQKR